MTVIAVKKLEKCIRISSDSQTSYGENYKFLETKKQIVDGEKIFEVNGMVIGCSGSVKGKNYLKVFCKTHKPKTATVDDVLDFVMEFADWFKKKDDKYDFDDKNAFILIYGGKMFNCNGFMVDEIKEYWATGSGMFLALGALYFGKDTEEAVEVAKEFDGWCGGETLTKEIKI